MAIEAEAILEQKLVGNTVDKYQDGTLLLFLEEETIARIEKGDIEAVKAEIFVNNDIVSFKPALVTPKNERLARELGLHRWYTVEFEKSVPAHKFAKQVAPSSHIEAIEFNTMVALASDFKARTFNEADHASTRALVPMSEFNDPYAKYQWNEYSVLGERKVAVSEAQLITHDKDGDRLVRIQETNLGDLCADAFREVMGADIGYVNGGGLRAPIAKGDVTFNDVLSVFPFNNQVVLAEVKGQDIKDFLELAVKYWPTESGAFPHLSGITFSVNTAIESAAQVDENWVFTGINGQYRVYNIKVQSRESGGYEPIDLNKTYSIASDSYHLLECGDGMSMFENAKILQNDGMLDVELLEKYITENLGGVIGEAYAEVKTNITFTEGEVIDTPNNNNQDAVINSPQTGENSHIVLWVLLLSISATCMVVLEIYRRKKAVK